MQARLSWQQVTHSAQCWNTGGPCPQGHVHGPSSVAHPAAGLEVWERGHVLGELIQPHLGEPGWGPGEEMGPSPGDLGVHPRSSRPPCPQAPTSMIDAYSLAVAGSRCLGRRLGGGVLPCWFLPAPHPDDPGSGF